MPIKSRGKAKSSYSSMTERQDERPLPQWPPLKPLIPAHDLVLHTILEDQILLIRNFFTSSLCKAYVSFLSSLPLVTTPGKPKRGDALRVNDRFQVDDPSFAEALWKTAGLRDLLTQASVDEETSEQDFSKLWGGEVCGLNPRIRIYRYSKSQFFGKHCELPFSLTVRKGPICK
ncbi:MAG: hypothetical protein L6R40_006863 [Gallowayella cf. fulva]|nr:MAG: hypothetical protein L6R40_006863 [Xanthomendoza cf. fulva]